MNKKLVLHMLGRLMLVEAGLMLPSLIIAWALKDGDEWPFLLSMLITVAVALPLTGVRTTLAHYRSVALLVGTSVLLLGTGLAAVAIRRSFRPLGDIERTASAITVRPNCLATSPTSRMFATPAL